MATTRSRPRGRETARPNTGGAVAEHLNKIYAIAVVGVVIVIAFLTLTRIGHVVDLATQHFMLYYAGVFALIALCAAVAFGLISTDRIILSPGHRVWFQSTHRAVSFGALVFLVIHIVTEILAQRVHVIDAFIPFLSPFNTFYIGLGTISFDLILLLVITGIMRKRFTVNGKAWRWRAIHYTSYVAFVFGIWHGLLAGRPAKPYYDWTYGVIIALTALGIAVRVLANSLRPKEALSAPPVAENASSGTGPLRAASMVAQLSAVRAAMPAALSAAPAGAADMLPAAGGWGAGAGPVAALPSGSGYGDAGYGDAGYGDAGYPDTTVQPGVYEPGYDGPPRRVGAPRNTGPMRHPSGPMPQLGNGRGSGPMPHPSGPMPQLGTGPVQRPATGPMPRPATGPMPHPSGPMPQAGNGRGAGPVQRPATGPMPRPATGPMPQAPGMGGGPQRRPAAGPTPGWRGGPPQPGPQYGGAPQPPYDSYDGMEGDPRGGQPWDGGYPEADPSLRYREPGPGMPGYRTSPDRFRGGEDLR